MGNAIRIDRSGGPFAALIRFGFFHEQLYKADDGDSAMCFNCLQGDGNLIVLREEVRAALKDMKSNSLRGRTRCGDAEGGRGTTYRDVGQRFHRAAL